MRFLILCLFFGIICATNKEQPIVNYDEFVQVVQIVEELKSQVDDLKKNRDGRINNLENELDYLKTINIYFSLHVLVAKALMLSKIQQCSAKLRAAKIKSF